MGLYTSSYLKSVARNTPFVESSRLYSDTRSSTSFDIFLSHSFLDKAAVEGLYFELSRMGFSVYVDWIVDPHLDRSNVTKATAEQVRQRLGSSRSLLLAISVNASVSKWMPWELGYADGRISNCAIVPVSDDPNPPSSYQGFEYLSLYPYVSRLEDLQGARPVAVDSSTRYSLLKDFIRGSRPRSQSVALY